MVACKTLKNLSIVISLFIFTCCSTSLPDLKKDGNGITRSLINKMETIHSREELLKEAPKLKQLFNRLADTMIQARKLQLSGKIDDSGLQPEDHLLSAKLRGELNRLYRLDRGKEIIENCQKDALEQLDKFEQKIRR